MMSTYVHLVYKGVLGDLRDFTPLPSPIFIITMYHFIVAYLYFVQNILNFLLARTALAHKALN